jgi:hypothetical protein
MSGLIAGIIAAVVGGVLAVGGGVALVSSQGGGNFPAQNDGSITVYGQN